MKKNEYIQHLNESLKHLPAGEREDIIAYYDEYFEGARQEGYSDEFIADSLGPPSDIAAQINSGNPDIARRARYHRTINEAVENPKAKTVVPAVFAGVGSAISLPFKIIGFILAIVGLITFTSLLIAFFAVGASLMAAGIAVVIVSFFVFGGSVAVGVFYVAAGIVIFGLGCMVLSGIISALKPAYKGLALAVKKITSAKRRYGNEKAI